MNPLVVHTSVPFGYLVVFLGIIALLLGGLAVAVVALRRRPARLGVATAGLLSAAFAASVLVINIRADNDLDLNPLIRTDSSLYGAWLGGGARLVLNPDSSYDCSGGNNCGQLRTSGRWNRRGDFDIHFNSGQSSVTYRVVRYKGTCRLIEGAGDPDLWDGSFLFEKIDSTSRSLTCKQGPAVN